MHRRDAVAAVAERGDDPGLPDGLVTRSGARSDVTRSGMTSPSCSQKRSVDGRTPRAAASSVIVIASSARSRFGRLVASAWIARYGGLGAQGLVALAGEADVDGRDRGSGLGDRLTPHFR